MAKQLNNLPSSPDAPGGACGFRNDDDVAARNEGWRLRVARLAAACAVVAAIWLILLPALARLRPIHDHIERMERARIDPSAMFYTEIEGMDEIRARVDAWREETGGPALDASSR